MHPYFEVMYTTGCVNRGLNVVSCVGSVQIEIDIEKGVLSIQIVKSNVSSVYPSLCRERERHA